MCAIHAAISAHAHLSHCYHGNYLIVRSNLKRLKMIITLSIGEATIHYWLYTLHSQLGRAAVLSGEVAVQSVETPRANFDTGVELLVRNRAHVVGTRVAKHSSTCPVRGEIKGRGEGKGRVLVDTHSLSLFLSMSIR